MMREFGKLFSFLFFFSLVEAFGQRLHDSGVEPGGLGAGEGDLLDEVVGQGLDEVLVAVVVELGQVRELRLVEAVRAVGPHRQLEVER